jgi:hypothetical protein
MSTDLFPLISVKRQITKEEMRNHRSQKVKVQQQAVLGFNNKNIRPMWQTSSSPPFRLNDARMRSESLNKAKKITKAIYSYILMFLESSSVHGLKHLTAKKRAVFER